MVIKLIISKSGITENFVLRLWEAGSDDPGAFVFEQTLVEKDNTGTPSVGAGHQVDEALTINGMDKVVHIARLYGATSGNLYFGPENIEPTTDIVTIFTPIRFKIGDAGANTPAANQSDALTPELAGLSTDDFTITRNNYGVLFPGVHFDFNTVDGSWALLNGDQFGAVEEFTIVRTPQSISTVVNDSVVGKWFGPTIASADIFVDITANTNYDAAHLRKLLRFNGAFTYTFNINPPIGYAYVFQNFGNPEVTATIAFTNAPLKWGAATKASIDLPAFSEGSFVWDGTNWNVIYLSTTSWVNTATVQPNAIIATGLVNIGDVPAGDPSYTVTHNMNIPGDYVVMISIKSNTEGGFAANNKVCSTWFHIEDGTKKDRFRFSLQEVSGEVQDLSVAWMIIKT